MLENLNDRVLAIPPVVMSFGYLRKGPLHIIAALSCLHDALPSPTPGQEMPRLNRCGVWKDPEKGSTRGFKGPVRACTTSGQALKRGNVMVCYRPLGEIPLGAPTKELAGFIVCGCVHQDGPLAQVAQQGVSDQEIALPDDHPARSYVRRWLVHALNVAYRTNEETLRHAAGAYIHDSECSVDESYVLGAFIHGLLLGEVPDGKQRKEGTDATAQTPAARQR